MRQNCFVFEQWDRCEERICPICAQSFAQTDFLRKSFYPRIDLCGAIGCHAPRVADANKALRAYEKYIRWLGILQMETQALGFVLERSPRRQPHLEHSIEEVQKASNPRALSLIETWENLKARGGMIVGQHFPSRKFASLLPNVLLLEKLERVRDFRIRVAGFGMLCFYGFDPSGRRLAELYGGEKHKVRYDALSRVIRGRPSLSLSRLCHDGETVLQREIVCLPVLASDAITPLVLVASFWNRRWLN